MIRRSLLSLLASVIPLAAADITITSSKGNETTVDASDTMVHPTETDVLVVTKWPTEISATVTQTPASDWTDEGFDPDPAKKQFDGDPETVLSISSFFETVTKTPAGEPDDKETILATIRMPQADAVFTNPDGQPIGQGTLASSGGIVYVVPDNGAPSTWSTVAIPPIDPSALAGNYQFSWDSDFIAVFENSGMDTPVVQGKDYDATKEYTFYVKGVAETLESDGTSFTVNWSDGTHSIPAADLIKITTVSDPAPDPIFYESFSSIDEASPTSYRKIRMDGVPHRERSPMQQSQSDSEDENTFVDAFSQTVSHQVTDIYIPFQGTDIALSIRRTTAPEAWSVPGSIAPQARPDRPFGPCWRSGFGAAIEVVIPMISGEGGSNPRVDLEQAVYAYVTDEDGASYRFAVAASASGGMSYLYMPSDGSDKKDGQVSLSGNSGNYVLSKKNGTSVSYSGETSRFATDHRGYVIARHLYSRMSSVILPGGEQMFWTPSTVTFRGKTISVAGGDRITAITDPNGNTTQFTYSDDLGTLSSVRKPDGSVIRYEYSGSQREDPKPLPPPQSGQAPVPPTIRKTLEISAIEDSRSGKYQFTYIPDETRYNYMRTSYYTGYYLSLGSPRLVSEITLPGGGNTLFTRSGVTRLGGPDSPAGIQASHSLLVKDAENGSWTYTFGSPQLVRVPEYKPPGAVTEVPYQNNPFVVRYETMIIGTPAGVVRPKFDSRGYLTSYADIGFSGAFRYSYDAVGNVTGRSDPDGNAYAYTYGSFNKLRTILDPEGRYTERTLGIMGRIERENVRESLSGSILRDVRYRYDDPRVPSVPTEMRILKSPADPAWAVDLVTRYDLDDAGNILKEIRGEAGDQQIVQHTYDANNNRLTTTDGRGNTTHFEYDSCNRLVKVDPPGPGVRLIGYDRAGNKVREVDERGIATLWQYDARNRPTHEARDMNGSLSIDDDDIVTTTTFDLTGLRTGIRSPNGDLTQFSYDRFGRLLRETDPLNHQIVHEYGANSGGLQYREAFRPTRSTNKRGFVTETTYDSAGRPLTSSNEFGTAPGSGDRATTTMQYDRVGNLIRSTDPLGRETASRFDALDRLVEITYPDQTRQSFSYTQTGLRWKAVDEAGFDTLTEFDSVGREFRVSSPPVPEEGGGLQRAVTETTYDSAGNVVGTKNPRGFTWTYSYDARNRKISEARPGPASPTVTWVYDDVGNVIKTIDARNNATETFYDAANRPVRVLAPAVPIAFNRTAFPQTTTHYDKNGNIRTVTDANNKTTLNSYDALGRIVTTTDAAGTVVTNEYDFAGNRTAVIDGKGQRTEFAYDGLGRNTKITDALGKSTVFEYDAVNKTARIDARGQRTAYGYDLRDRLTNATYPGRSQDNRTYRYDPTGNLLSVVEPGKQGTADVAYTYDALRRQTTETSGGLTHSYAYDLAGNRVSCLYGGQTIPLISRYDEENRLVSLKQGAMETLYAYDANGNGVSRRLPNGDLSTSTFDALNRTTTLATANAAGASVQSYAYLYDLVGNVRRVTETYGNAARNRVVTNTYDGINRLVSEIVTGNGAATTLFTYDPAHNRGSMSKDGLTTSYTYNAANQLLAAQSGTTTTTFTYDDNGNRTSRSVGSASSTFEWDSENRLIAYSTLVNQTRIEFLYDYRSRRTETVNRTFPQMAERFRTKYVFSGGVSVREFLNGLPTVDYVRGSDWGGGVGGILYTLRGGTPSFTHFNRRGDVTAKTNASGEVTYQASYQAFGLRASETGATEDRQKSNTKDEDIPGYANEGFRFRDLETGTFLSKDPAGFVDGPNLYTYVRQNPWTAFDPEGLSEVSIWDSLAPATAAVARGGQSPWGGERGAVAASRQFQTMHAGVAAVAGAPYAATIVGGATLATVAAAPELAAVGGPTLARATTAIMAVAARNPQATVAAVEAGIVGGVVYAETGDPVAAATSAGLTGLNSYASGVGGKPAQKSTQQRAEEIHGSLPEATARRTTTAVAEVTNPNGTTSRWVASSETSLRPAQRAALESGEVAVSGPGHAEQTLIDAAKASGATVNSVAASRPICGNCQTAISGAAATPASPVKPPPKEEKAPAAQ